MQRWMMVLIVFCVGVIVFPRDGSAQIPRTLSYQGILSDTLGTPKPDGMYAITFRLYDAPSGGTLLWAETQSLQVKRGLFSAVLGSQTPFPSSLTFERQYWLGIQPAGNPELVPRIALSAVGYSLNSLRADTARVALNAGIFADSARIAGTVPNNSITANKIAAGQVVKSINNIRDAVTLRAQGGATITSSGDTITINAGSGGGGTGVQSIQNTNNTIDIINPTGPTVTANLKVPLSLTAATTSPNAVLSARNTSTTGGLPGVYGESTNGYGVFGKSTALVGVRGEGGTRGGDFEGGSYGVFAISPTGWGVWGGTSSSTSNSTGVYGVASATSGDIYGVRGIATSSSQGVGVKGEGSTGVNGTGGTFGGTFSGTYGVFGTGALSGVWGVTNSATSGSVGVIGVAVDPSGLTYGVKGATNSSTFLASGVRGEATSSSGQTIGVEGVSTASPQGTGVAGRGNAVGGYFTAANGTAVVGYGITGAYFETSTGDGVYGVSGGGPNTAGVHGRGTGPSSTGVWGQGSGQGANQAGWFSGNVTVDGNFSVQNGVKSFLIDHPLDPEHKTLRHACIESNEVLNQYSGNVVTDENGFAEIVLPDWFEAINKDFRYQLTVIGRFAQAIVEEEIHNNRFTIRTNFGNVKVSWQVTAVRNDAYMRAHPMVVEEVKPPEEQGTYLSPKEWGQPEEKGKDYPMLQKVREEQAKHEAEMAKHQAEAHRIQESEQARMKAEQEKMNLERQKMRPQPLGK